MSRSVYRINTAEMINRYLQQVEEHRQQAQKQKLDKKISRTQRETQELLAKLDAAARQMKSHQLPMPKVVVDLNASDKAARQISDLHTAAIKSRKVFKPDEIPLTKIIDEYIPAFTDAAEPVDEKIAATVGQEVLLAVRTKLHKLGFKAVDEEARIFRGAITVSHEGHETTVGNVVAIGKDGNVYIGHPDKHHPDICDAVAKRLNAELSKTIHHSISKGLANHYKRNIEAPLTKSSRNKDPLRLERENCG